MPYNPLIHQDRQNMLADLQNRFPEADENFVEALASRRFQKLIDKYQHYTGVELTPQTVQHAIAGMGQSLVQIAQLEDQHKERLEQLAIDLVFELPQFKSFKAPYEAGEFKIEPEIVGMELNKPAGVIQQKSKIDNSPEEKASMEGPDIDLDDPNVSDEDFEAHTSAEDLKTAVNRRGLTNALIQGGAVSNNYAFELGGAELDRIDPDLRRLYGQFITSTDIAYWIVGDEVVKAAAGGGAVAGATEVEVDDDGIPTIRAIGTNFPVIVQEIVKGLMELASLPSIPDDEVKRNDVLSRADLVSAETWNMMLGPQLWEAFLEAVDVDSERELAVHLYSAIQHMDDHEFQQFMHDIWNKTDRGRANLRKLAMEVKDAVENGDDESGYTPESKTILDSLMEEDTLSEHVASVMLHYLPEQAVTPENISAVVKALPPGYQDTTSIFHAIDSVGLASYRDLYQKLKDEEGLT